MPGVLTSRPLLMSDRLNDDVLLAILEHIAEPARDQRGFQARQSTLLSLCLASCQLRSLAEPLLWRQVRFKSVVQLEQLRARHAATGLGRRTEVFVVPWRERVVHGEGVLDVATFLPRIAHMELRGTYASLRPLARHIELRRLSLWQVTLPATLSTVPQLEQLAIRDSSAPKSVLDRWLDPSYLPRLRALLLCGFKDPDQLISIATVLSPSILAQLDLVQTDDRSLDAHEPLAWSDEPPCLCYHSPRSEAVVRYNLYGPSSVDTPSVTWATRRSIDAGVLREQRRERGPFVFVFPASAMDQMAKLGVPQLDEQGLCVLFDDGDSCEAQSSELVSHEVWRLARALKDERARWEQEGTE
ncbi:hypothetical protein JCM9279_000999 [Rhodotorula babjevae]